MKPNVLLLIIDSFRADKFYGDDNIPTPNIDYLIKNGTYFSQTISAADATLLSWSSIFTGLYPFKTGIRSTSFNKLNPDIPTLFKIFKKFRYNFYGYVPKIGDIIGLFPNFKNTDAFYESYKNLYEGNGKSLSNKIFKILENKIEDPWFFFVHLYDLHDPMIVPTSFNNEKFGTSTYDRQVSAMDNWIGQLTEKINFENTLLIITADHGKYIKTVTSDKVHDFESNPHIQRTLSKIGSHTPKFLNPIKDKVFFSMESMSQKKRMKMIEKLNLNEHEKRSAMSGKTDIDHYLYDDKVKIPLLFLGFGIEKNKIISQQIRSVDILPTILEITGNTSQDQPFDGQSLKPLIVDKNLDEKPAYIESNPLVMVNSNDVIGIRTSSYKYFRDRDNPKKRIHLFDLKNDFKETKNLANSEPEIVQKMESLLKEIRYDWESSEVKSNYEETKLIEDELKKLGYL